MSVSPSIAQLRKVAREVLERSGSGVLAIKTSQRRSLVHTASVLLELTGHLKATGIYVALERPSRYIGIMLEHHGGDPTRLFYLDAVTAISAEDPPDLKNVLYVDPFDLAEMVRTIREALKEEVVRFVTVDSLIGAPVRYDEVRLEGFINLLAKVQKEHPEILFVLVLDERWMDVVKRYLNSSNVQELIFE